MKASIGNSHGVVTVNDCFSVMKKFKIEIKHVGSYLIKVSNRNTGTPSEVAKYGKNFTSFSYFTNLLHE